MGSSFNSLISLIDISISLFFSRKYEIIETDEFMDEFAIDRWEWTHRRTTWKSEQF
ncbi:MAG: hypothetical protein ACI86H_002537 [bacterium]|jgi:hypothetical protein